MTLYNLKLVLLHNRYFGRKKLQRITINLLHHFGLLNKGLYKHQTQHSLCEYYNLYGFSKKSLKCQRDEVSVVQQTYLNLMSVSCYEVKAREGKAFER